MIDRTVTDALFFHVPDNGFECRKVTAGIAVKLHIADVTGVGQGMIRGFQLDFLVSLDGVVNRDVERVGVIFTVGDAGDLPVNLRFSYLTLPSPDTVCADKRVPFHFPVCPDNPHTVSVLPDSHVPFEIHFSYPADKDSCRAPV